MVDASEVQLIAGLTALRWLYEERDELAQTHQAARMALVPPEVWEAWARLDDEFNAQMAAVVDSIASIEGDIKAGVVALGHTIKDPFIQVVYTPGRATWDGKFLDGYAAGHPEILVARKVGQPSASIRKLSPKAEG